MKDSDFAKYSVPTILFDPNDHNRPLAGGTCCFLNYRGHLLILTVGHVASKYSWGIESGYDPVNGLKIAMIGEFLFQKKITVGSKDDLERFLERADKDGLEFNPISPDDEDVDFAFVKFPSTLSLLEIGKDVLMDDLTTEPHPDGEYGFFGLTRTRTDGDKYYRVPRLERGLRFIEKSGDYFVFKPTSPIRSHADYAGCSGAPILDNDGRLVALLKGGDIAQNIILGAPTSGSNKLAIDGHLGFIRKSP